jgi:hypothetical protein
VDTATKTEGRATRCSPQLSVDFFLTVRFWEVRPSGRGRHRPPSLQRSNERARDGQLVRATCALTSHVGEFDWQFAGTRSHFDEGSRVRPKVK